ncbi:alpha/beta fold hydrolase [Deinococcus ruber]|uniref:Alpha/beta hydrolase n=1 Tax=Deinococcus ruber TaxID=1848197 RepID=A0A918CH81_9DEIO|nr:alpha/beta hydrolase [Deinococcus ruber]GGR24121.1 alpha/beta hydrolase [Deinococcus ruber]
MTLQQLQTEKLSITYEVGGPSDGPVVLLLHGWPDDPRGWRVVAAKLQQAGYRTLTPYLRGFGPTQFLSSDTVRDGRGVALARDALDLLDALGVSRCAVIGHDWGARAAYTLAALAPERLTAIVGIALAFQPQARFTVPAFSQARRFWYQWFMTLDAGAEAVRADPVGFAKLQWDTWSPAGWYALAEFEQTAQSFRHPDWAEITLSAYRSRWQSEPLDAEYDVWQRHLETVAVLDVPTLMIQGGADTCDEPASSLGLEASFSAGYTRIVLDAVGHFPHREAPAQVTAAILAHLAPFV